MPNNRPRGTAGRFAPNFETAQRDGEAARLRMRGKTYQEIADTLGYASKGSAHDAVARAIRAARVGPTQEAIEVEAGRLEALYEEALGVLEREHVTVSNGRVVVDDTGATIPDDGPRLAAIRELRAIRESYRKLLGLDQPAKVDMSGGVKYEIVGINPEDIA